MSVLVGGEVLNEAINNVSNDTFKTKDVIRSEDYRYSGQY